MYFRKRTMYLLFLAAYVGALLIERPMYTEISVLACFSYLFTVMVHFGLFTGLIVVNNAVLIPRFLAKRQFSAFTVGLFSSIAIYGFCLANYNRLIHQVWFHDTMIQTSGGLWSSMVYALCCLVIVAMLDISRRWSEQQDQVKNSQISQLQTELKYLRAQINPHFLFNGLNTVYGYIDSSNYHARDMMVQFSDLLRYNLYDADVDFTALDKEVKYLQNYVDLQKARSNDNVHIKLSLDHPNGTVRIAPLIFMAFVENAFKYASRGDEMMNRIEISLKEKDGSIHFTCINSCDEVKPSKGGIGLNNTRRRLELLYKDRYVLDIKEEHNLYTVNLTLNP